jgi:indole-3-glycerol phosphate synthase
MDDLRQATGGVEIPVMRKEFIVDEYQLFEAKLSGASAVLLIAAAITREECRRFTELANQLQLEVLLELHDEGKSTISGRSTDLSVSTTVTWEVL